MAPVLVGIGAALHDGHFRAVPFAATLAAAMLIQIGTNFANEVSDFERGADAGRQGYRFRLGRTPTRLLRLGDIAANRLVDASKLL